VPGKAKPALCSRPNLATVSGCGVFRRLVFSLATNFISFCTETTNVDLPAPQHQNVALDVHYIKRPAITHEVSHTDEVLLRPAVLGTGITGWVAFVAEL